MHHKDRHAYSTHLEAIICCPWLSWLLRLFCHLLWWNITYTRENVFQILMMSAVWAILLTYQLISAEFKTWICNHTLTNLHRFIRWNPTIIHPCIIDQLRKSQNAPEPSSALLHSEQNCAHFCSEWSILGFVNFVNFNGGSVQPPVK